jgi:hypothetical protein
MGEEIAYEIFNYKSCFQGYDSGQPWYISCHNNATLGPSLHHYSMQHARLFDDLSPVSCLECLFQSFKQPISIIS